MRTGSGFLSPLECRFFDSQGEIGKLQIAGISRDLDMALPFARA